MFAGTSSKENSVMKNESDDEDDDQEYMEIESLSANQIMELIELSFFQACYALSKGDIQPLKLFVIAVKTASKKYEGASALAISETVDSLLPSVRPLDDGERKLRDTWIRAVYLMLGHVMEDFSGGDSSNPDDDEVFKTYGPVLVDLVAVHQTGMGLNVNQFVASRKDMLLLEPKNKNILVLDDEEENEDPVQLAVVTQTINVLFTTLVVLEEEAKSDDSTTNDSNSSSNSKNKNNSHGESSSKPSTSKNKKKSGSSGRGFG
eukprot:CAMPEP_0168217488 /NCGR_PEP_ID=MMETSP0140_2-20121125/7281_1 /TAXON_ID=44445 /ORGANISM="Pseudo-nitzschia australis, Strain 10249 10 AB" /LENGTH=261 /DNA_ID=CAMNT_0008145261 /DNA_START=343 /DNA_END=1128 /DNA_ORIENTATION=-